MGREDHLKLNITENIFKVDINYDKRHTEVNASKARPITPIPKA